MKNKKEILIHNIAAKFIIGENIDIELKGSEAEIYCLYELLTISKQLKESLDNDDSFDSILKIANRKKQISKKFQNLTGIVWRL